jgi:hypothetical protein
MINGKYAIADNFISKILEVFLSDYMFWPPQAIIKSYTGVNND